MDSGTLIAAAAGMFAFLLIAAALLKAWQDWLDLKRAQLNGDLGRRQPAEVRELRKRVFRLERIALGLD